MMFDDDEAKISKSLIKTDIEIKNIKKLKMEKKTETKQKAITKPNLQDALDLEFVGYNNDIRLVDLDDLETVGYNNDTSITDLEPIKKL